MKRKAIKLFAIVLAIAFLAMSCSPKYQFYPYPFPGYNDSEDGNDDGQDTPPEPEITDPYKTDDPETYFYDNFTSQDTVGNYFYQVSGIDINANQKHENGVATLYGGAQLMMFSPKTNNGNGIDLLKNDYTMEFTFTPSADFSTGASDNKAYAFTAGMSYLKDDGFLGETRSIFMTFADSEDANKLDVGPTYITEIPGNDGKIPTAECKISITKGEPATIKIEYGLTDYRTVELNAYVNDTLVASNTAYPLTENKAIDSFSFSIWGPNGRNFGAPDSSSFGSLDSLKVSVEKKSTPVTVPSSVTYPDIDYTNGKTTLSNADGVTTSLKTLQDSSKLVLSKGDYNMQKDTETTYGGQTGWLFYVGADNVAIVAADGAYVTIESDDATANGSWADQNLMTIAGDNAVLANLNIGTRVNKNKSVEVVGDNAIIDGCTFLEDAVLYFNSAENGTPINNVTVKNCTFLNGAMLVLCNGVDGTITIADNTFKEGSTLKITGYRNSGWNEMSVDLADAVFAGNTFETGSSFVISYDETNTTLNGSLSAFDVSSVADNLGSAVESAGAYGETNFTYTAK